MKKSRRERPRKRWTFWDYNDLGIRFFNRRAYDLAVGAFTRAVHTAGFPLSALDINLGAAYFGRGKYEEARAWLEKGLAIDPEIQEGHWFLARVLKQKGLVPEALVEFKRVYALDSESPEGRRAEQEIACLSVVATKIERPMGNRRSGGSPSIAKLRR